HATKNCPRTQQTGRNFSRTNGTIKYRVVMRFLGMRSAELNVIMHIAPLKPQCDRNTSVGWVEALRNPTYDIGKIKIL
ncbi:MAG: hypothetical protein ACFCUV_12330, partial [Rivularia sp. (in: cyanobacteria)]